MEYELSEFGVKNPQIFFDGNELSRKDIGLFDGLKVHPTGNVFDHIGTIRTEVKTANCAFDENFQYLYMTSDMYLTRIKLLESF